MSVIRTKALILRHSTDREHDRLIVVLTPQHGQMRIRARGTKKSVSKLGGSLEPLTEVDLMLANGRTVDVVTGSVILDRFEGLRRDIVSLTMAQWLLELVERVTKPNQHDPALYDLVVGMLSDMAKSADVPAGQRWLHLLRRAWLILDHQGFAPSFERCAVCHQPLAADNVAFHPTTGFVHRRESSTAPARRNALPHASVVLDEAPAEAALVRPSVIAFLRGGDSADDRQIFAALRRLVDAILHHTLDRPLRSDGVLRSVLRTATLPK